MTGMKGCQDVTKYTKTLILQSFTPFHKHI